MTNLNENLHMEGLDDLEVAMHVDQGLASLNARFDDRDEKWDLSPELSHDEIAELADAITVACDAWDRVADLLPGFREVAPCPVCGAEGADQSCIEDGRLIDDHAERGA